MAIAPNIAAIKHIHTEDNPITVAKIEKANLSLGLGGFSFILFSKGEIP